MYKLILTRSERDAIDWIGNRYPHGDDLFRLLWVECDCRRVDNNELAEAWDERGEFEFSMTKDIWQRIRDIRAQDAGDWTCFAPALKDKLNQFCDKEIVSDL